MYKESDQITEFNKSALNTALHFTQIALDSTERLMGVQWVSTKQSLVNVHDVLQPETERWDLQSLCYMPNKLAEKCVENAAIYLRNLCEVAAYTKSQIADLFAIQWRDWTRPLSNGIPQGLNDAREQLPKSALEVYEVETAAAQDSPEPFVAVPTSFEAAAEPQNRAVTDDATHVPEVLQDTPDDAALAEALPLLLEASRMAQEVVEAVVVTESISENAQVVEAVVATESISENAQEELPQPESVRGEAILDIPQINRTAIKASDFTGARVESAPPAKRAVKNSKPLSEKSKSAATKGKQTAKR